jgi:hypothetical protein
MVFTLPKMNRKFAKCELENSKKITYAFLTLASFKLQLFCLQDRASHTPWINVGGPPGLVKIWWKREKSFHLQ